jgi:hypothetical protein
MPKEAPQARKASEMTPAEFTKALEQELHLTGRPFDRASVLAFVEAVWPLVEDDPDIGLWATEFWETDEKLATI